MGTAISERLAAGSRELTSGAPSTNESLAAVKSIPLRSCDVSLILAVTRRLHTGYQNLKMI
jgi:hypothetical protein